jgi:hypothetical protein
MPRTLAGFVPLLAVLVLALPGNTVAGPPEGVSGKMTLLRDEVVEGLRKCLREKDQVKRLEMLDRLARTRDPRVAVSLAELAWKPTSYVHRADSDELARGAETLLMYTYFPYAFHRCEDPKRTWDEKGGDLRRRAKQLPQ